MCVVSVSSAEERTRRTSDRYDNGEHSLPMVTLDNDDEGKRVVDSNGVEMGVVVEVDAGRAYVDPDPNMLDEIGSRFGISSADEETFPIEDSDVQSITDNEIRLSERTDPKP